MPKKEEILKNISLTLSTLSLPPQTISKLEESCKYLVENLDTNIVRRKHTSSIANAIIKLAGELEGVHIKIPVRKDIIALLRKHYQVNPPELTTIIAQQLSMISKAYNINKETESKIFQRCKQLLEQLQCRNPSSLTAFSIIAYVLFRDAEFRQLKKRKKLKLVTLAAMFGLNDAAVRAFWSAHGLTNKKEKKEEERKIPIPKHVLSDAPVIKIAPINVEEEDEDSGLLTKLKKLLR